MEELRMDKPVATEKKARLVKVPAGTVVKDYRLKKDLLVEIVQGNTGEFITSTTRGILFEYGHGPTKKAAIDDLVTSLGDGLESMQKFEATLDDSSLERLRILREVIERG